MSREKRANIGYYFIITASVVVILAGIKMASVIMVPFLLSLFLAIILAPFFLSLKKIGLGELFSLILIIAVLVSMAMFIITLVGSMVSIVT